MTPAMATTMRRPVAAAPRPVAASFVTLGVFWGTWAVLIADVKRTFALGDTAIGVLLAISLGSAAVAGTAVGHRAEHWGSRPMLVGSLTAWAVLLVGAGLAPTWPVFATLFAAAAIAGGCADMAMNAAASSHFASRPGALVRFHALFNVGALCGAGIAGVALGVSISWRVLWPAIAFGVAAIAIWAAKSRATDPRPGAPVPAGPAGPPAASIPRRGGVTAPLRALQLDGLLLFLCVFALAEITEGGVDTWGVLYLRTHLAAGVLLGAGAYVVGQSVAAAARGLGGPVLGRLSVRLALVVGGIVAGTGILVESKSTAAVVAAFGLAAGAAGASLFWPLVMSQVIRQATRPLSAVSTFTAAGYVGLVGGAPIVGLVSESWGPARGLQLLGILALVVAVAGALHGGRRASSRRRR